MDRDDLGDLLGKLPSMKKSRETDTLLEELQRAADEHQKILVRQSELIRRLREELKEVER